VEPTAAFTREVACISPTISKVTCNFLCAYLPVSNMISKVA